VVRPQQQARVRLQARVGLQAWVGRAQERDADVVWLGLTRRRVRTDGAEVETGLDERVAAERRRAAPLCSQTAELEPCQHGSWREYWCGRWTRPQGE
jgi:hypothetical protein